MEIRKTISIATLQRIEEYLKKQKQPVTKRKIMIDLGVNYNSVIYALNYIDRSLLRKVKWMTTLSDEIMRCGDKGEVDEKRTIER